MVDGVKRDESILTVLDIISTAFTESITSLVLIKRWLRANRGQW